MGEEEERPPPPAPPRPSSPPTFVTPPALGSEGNWTQDKGRYVIRRDSAMDEEGFVNHGGPFCFWGTGIVALELCLLFCLMFFLFLDAPSHLYKRLYPSVRPSIRPSPVIFKSVSCAVYPALFSLWLALAQDYSRLWAKERSHGDCRNIPTYARYNFPFIMTYLIMTSGCHARETVKLRIEEGGNAGKWREGKEKKTKTKLVFLFIEWRKVFFNSRQVDARREKNGMRKILDSLGKHEGKTKRKPRDSMQMNLIKKMICELN